MSLYESENHSRSSSNGPTPIKMNIGGTPRTEKAGLIEGKMTPLTPTANLKILMSAVSPALREKERQEKEATSSQSKAVRAIFASPKEPRKVESDYDRKAKSLGLLCRKFLTMTESEIGTDSPFSLEAVANSLGINRRRIYDIINIFESLELVEKHSKNLYVWHSVNGLPVTLAKLKAIAELEGPMIFCDRPSVLQNPEFQWRMKGGEYYNKFNLGVQQEGVLERPVVPSGGDWQMDTFSSQRDDEDGEEEKKNDRSLGLLCQKFLMLLLVLPESEVTLDFAAQVILADDETIDMTGRAKPKVRRLYDIANVLVSMGLIAKDHYINTTEGCHKPGFYWIGPDISDTSHIVVTRKPDIELLRGRKCSSKSVMSILGRKHLCGTKHSLLNCFNINVIDSTSSSPPERQKVRSHSAPSSPVTNRDMGILKKTKKAILSTTQLELEALLFGMEIKPLENKYPKVFKLVSEFIKKSCGESMPLCAPSVIRNPSNSEDKNEPVYIFNSQGTAGRRQSSRASSEGQRLAVAGMKRVPLEQAALAKRRLTEDSDLTPEELPDVEASTTEPSSSIPTGILYPRRPALDDLKLSTVAPPHPSPPLPNPGELLQQLKGNVENFSPSVFLKVPQFLAAQKTGSTGGIGCANPATQQAIQSMSRVLVRPLGSMVSPAGLGIPVHQLVTGIKPQVSSELQQQPPQHPLPILPKVSEATVSEKSVPVTEQPAKVDVEPEDIKDSGDVDISIQETEPSETMEYSIVNSQAVDSSPSESVVVSVSPAVSTFASSVLPPQLTSTTNSQDLNAKLLQTIIRNQSALSQPPQPPPRLPFLNAGQLTASNTLQSCVPPMVTSPLPQPTNLVASLQTQLSQLASTLSTTGGHNPVPATSSQISMPTIGAFSTMPTNLIGSSQMKPPSTISTGKSPVPLKPKKTATRKATEQSVKRVPLADVSANVPKSTVGQAAKPPIQPTPNLASLLTHVMSNNTSNSSNNPPAQQANSLLDTSFVSRLNSTLQFLASTNITLNEETAELLAKLLHGRDTLAAISESSVVTSQTV